MKARSPGFARGYSLWRDLAIATAAGLLVAAVSSATQFSENLFAWTRGFEHYQLDEWPIALLAFAVVMIGLFARRHAQLRRVLQENRRLLSRLLAVQEEERRRLARELHDELGQTLNAIKLDAIALGSARESAEVGEIARRIAGDADQMYGSASNLIRDLRPPALDELGLKDAIRACVDRWQASHPALVMHLSAGGDLDGLGESLNLSLYRLVQEALTNCVRHAAAQNVYIDLTRDDGAQGKVLLEMRDDGVGFDTGAAMAGHGLMGMRERIGLLQGQFEVISQPGRGTTIRIDIPVPGRPT